SGSGPGAVTILVADNGPGLPRRAREHLFAPFQGSARSGGTGLGLAIASELVRLNGGTLSLDPEGPGTCFRIVLPDQPASG
ncbi:sensor histidine kinase, partial [Methylobacterium trifolii]